MAKEGVIEWDGASKSTAIVYWRKPEEWANVIHEWVNSTASSRASPGAVVNDFFLGGEIRSIVQDRKARF
jgi:hypothetical protein